MTAKPRPRARPPEKLSGEQRRRLRQLERVIERGLAEVRAMGDALREIRDSRLYRESHDSFGSYVRDRWGLARQTAYDYIAFARVSENVGTSLLPTVAHAHALAGLPPEQQKEVAPAVADLPVSEMRPAVQAAREGLSEGVSRTWKEGVSRTWKEPHPRRGFDELDLAERRMALHERFEEAITETSEARRGLAEALNLWLEAAEEAVESEQATPEQAERLQEELSEVAQLLARGEALAAAARGQMSLAGLGSPAGVSW